MNVNETLVNAALAVAIAYGMFSLCTAMIAIGVLAAWFWKEGK